MNQEAHRDRKQFNVTFDGDKMIDLEVIFKANVKARGWLETGSVRNFRLLSVECQHLQRPAVNRGCVHLVPITSPIKTVPVELCTCKGAFVL